MTIFSTAYSTRSVIWSSFALIALLVSSSGRAELPDLKRWEGDVDVPFKSEIHWMNERAPKVPVSSIHVTNNVGTITYRGETMSTVMMAYNSAPEYDLTGFLALSKHQAVVITAVCEKGLVTYLVVDSFSEGVSTEVPASGYCKVETQPTVSHIRMPRWMGAPLKRRPFDQLEINGPHIQFSRSHGWIEFDKKRFKILPFGLWDYTNELDGHFEVYVLLETPGRLEFAVLMLAPKRPNVIPVQYRFRYDTPGLPKNFNLDGQWSIKKPVAPPARFSRSHSSERRY